MIYEIFGQIPTFNIFYEVQCQYRFGRESIKLARIRQVGDPRRSAVRGDQRTCEGLQIKQLDRDTRAHFFYLPWY